VKRTLMAAALVCSATALCAVLAGPAMADDCSSNWKICADNADLANNNTDYGVKAKVACKMAAEDMAKYGTPEWPWLSSFGTFLKGDDYLKTGIVTLIERDAGFKNAFNATVRSRVTCTYDLNTNRVIDVEISDRLPETTFQPMPQPPQSEPKAAAKEGGKAFDQLLKNLERAEKPAPTEAQWRHDNPRSESLCAKPHRMTDDGCQ